MRVVLSLLTSLHQALPPWLFATLLIVGVVLLARPFYRSILSRQINRAVGVVSRAGSVADRVAAEDAALALAGSNMVLIATVGDAAVRYNQPLLARRVLDLLEKLGDTKDIVRLKKLMLPDSTRRPAHPIEVAAAVQRLLEGGLYDAAKLRLDEGLSRFPDDPDLVALREKLPPT